ncbi:adenosine deaminase, partial [Planctomycetota bacterium]
AGADGLLWDPSGDERRLADEIDARERAGSQLLGSYLEALARDERHESWRTLYRLPPGVIDRMRRTTLDEQHRSWLRRLPKADLHCHLGGVLGIDAQRRVARAVWEAAEHPQRSRAEDRVRGWLERGFWPPDWRKQLHDLEQERPFAAARLLLELDTHVLEQLLFGPTEPRVALAERDFSLYEQPGELSGSALLSHPAALRAYVEEIVALAQRDGIRYLELRGSPHKYVQDPESEVDWLRALENAFTRAIASSGQKLTVTFLVIADRRSEASAGLVVQRAVDAKLEMPDFVAGLDLAGDERAQSPEAFVKDFLPAFEACLPVTVHAGEGHERPKAENIWKAVYHLHADRVGHGLRLADQQRLRERFRDRGICLELCPTSNVEVVGFCDPARADTQDLPRYPLLNLWRSGVPVAICSDNPGISRTDITNEYLVAARLCGELTVWDALAIHKQGFRRAFLPARQREELLKEVDAKVYRLCLEGLEETADGPV